MRQLERPLGEGDGFLCQTGSSSKRCGYSSLTMAAHEPDGQTTDRRVGEGADGMAGEIAGVIVKAAVEVRLAAAGLRRREIDVDAEAAQQLDGGDGASGKKASPRQVTSSETRTRSIELVLAQKSLVAADLQQASAFVIERLVRRSGRRARPCG